MKLARKDKTGILRDLTTDLSFEYAKPEDRFSTPTENSDEPSKLVDFLKWIVITMLVSVAIVFVFRVTMSPTYIDGDSMNPTLKDGQVWFSMNKYLREPERGDIVRAYSKDDMVNVVKRVVAKEGDVLSVSDKGIFVNGDMVDNSKGTMELFDNSTSWLYSHKDDTLTLNRGEFFVLGDNRDNSHDSRDYGILLVSDIQTVLTKQAPDWFARFLK